MKYRNQDLDAGVVERCRIGAFFTIYNNRYPDGQITMDHWQRLLYLLYFDIVTGLPNWQDYVPFGAFSDIKTRRLVFPDFDAAMVEVYELIGYTTEQITALFVQRTLELAEGT